MQEQQGTAVVIGGSMAGLLAARVLSESFAQVVIIERDSLPENAEQRRGAPQGHHAHALLGKGRLLLEHYFPGITESLVAQGAPMGHGRLFSGGGYFARLPQAPPSLYVSRPCLEAEVRRRVRSLANVRVHTNCAVEGLVVDEGERRIAGVWLGRASGELSAGPMKADLVVDAGGRGTRVPGWLEDLGFPKPAVELVEVGMGYASRFYRREPEHLGGDLVINIAPTPDNRRASAAVAQEGERWLVTLAGYFGDHPPVDEAGFLAFARKLPTRDIYDLIRHATPLTDPVPFKFPANLRRRYEHPAGFPEGLLPIGDAICSFTPIYGQGMTVAAMEAQVLAQCLAQGRRNLARCYFRQIAKVIDIPWSLTVGNDRRLANAQLPLPNRLLNWYLGKLQVVARRDPEVALAFLKVGNLFNAPASLLHPKIAARVLWGSIVRPASRRTGRTIEKTESITAGELG